MPITKLSTELYEVYRAADAIASRLYYGLPVTDDLVDAYRKANDHWYSLQEKKETTHDLPDRCREEGVNG